MENDLQWFLKAITKYLQIKNLFFHKTYENQLTFGNVSIWRKQENIIEIMEIWRWTCIFEDHFDTRHRGPCMIIPCNLWMSHVTLNIFLRTPISSRSLSKYQMVFPHRSPGSIDARSPVSYLCHFGENHRICQSHLSYPNYTEFDIIPPEIIYGLFMGWEVTDVPLCFENSQIRPLHSRSENLFIFTPPFHSQHNYFWIKYRILLVI